MLAKTMLGRVVALNSYQMYSVTLPTLSKSKLVSFPFVERSISTGNRLTHNDASRNNFFMDKEFLRSTIYTDMLNIQVRNYPARKGTREKREKLKKKRKKEKIIVAKVPFLLRRKQKQDAATIYRVQRPNDYSNLGNPVDDVYFYHKYDEHQWTFETAVQNHRETHHPTMYNRPNCPLILRIHLDFQYPNRPNKFQDGWKTVVEMKQPFLLPGMVAPTVLAFCPNEPSLIEEAIEAGADMAGSSEIIRSIQAGAVNPNDFEYIVCHPSMITELTVIRGLIKRKFPNLKTKTLDSDVPRLVQQFKAGIKIQGCTTGREPDYGWVETPIGTLDMDINGMEANFEAILADTLIHRIPGRTADTFILGCILKTAFSFEKFKLNAQPYILKHDKRPTQVSKESSSEEQNVDVKLKSDESEEKDVKVQASSN